MTKNQREIKEASRATVVIVIAPVMEMSTLPL